MLWRGFALAAPQVSIPQRFFVLAPHGELQRGMPMSLGNTPPTPVPEFMANPSIRSHGKTIRFKESCLSIPGVAAWHDRYESVVVWYQDIYGLDQTLFCSGTLAVVVQHELDHLDGRLFVDDLEPYERNRITPKLNKFRARL